MVTVGEYKPAAVSWRDCMAGYVIRTPGLPISNASDRDGESSVTSGVSTVTAAGVTRRRPRPRVLNHDLKLDPRPVKVSVTQA